MKQRIRRWVIGWMMGVSLVLLLGLAAASLPTNSPAAANSLIDLQRVDPRIRLDIRYATTHNFTHTRLYGQSRCILHGAIATALSQVQTDLAAQGLGLKVYDCYRPLAVQRRMWQLVPDERYVANPARGSRHNRGAAVDLALVDGQGRDLPMPTDFDDFTERAWRSDTSGTGESRHNSQILELAMINQGFVPLATEWWHFDGPGWQSFPVIDTPFEAVDVARSTHEIDPVIAR